MRSCSRSRSTCRSRVLNCLGHWHLLFTRRANHCKSRLRGESPPYPNSSKATRTTFTVSQALCFGQQHPHLYIAKLFGLFFFCAIISRSKRLIFITPASRPSITSQFSGKPFANLVHHNHGRRISVNSDLRQHRKMSRNIRATILHPPIVSRSHQHHQVEKLPWDPVHIPPLFEFLRNSWFSSAKDLCSEIVSGLRGLVTKRT